MDDISNRDLAIELKQNLDKRLEALPAMQKSLHEIDKTLAVTMKACNTNAEDIDKLQDKSDRNDLIVAFLGTMAAIGAAIFGGR